MAADISKIPTSELDLEGAFRRSRNGAIVLTVVLVSYLIQTVPLIGPAVEVFQASIAGEFMNDAQAETLGMEIIMLGLSLFALILTLFAWFMRSRVAMWLGVLLFVFAWINYIFLWVSGDFEVSGLLLNILGPYYLWRGVQGANRYHALKRDRPQTDVSVFE
jgi:uncharacterized Tic20 family protein